VERKTLGAREGRNNVYGMEKGCNSSSVNGVVILKLKLGEADVWTTLTNVFILGLNGSSAAH
jgi:hypothetical protein